MRLCVSLGEGPQSKPESLMAAPRRYYFILLLYTTCIIPRRAHALLASASNAALGVPFPTPLRSSTRARGNNERSLPVVPLGALMMERLNACSRSTTVRAQRSQPTGAVDLLLEPLILACARDTSRVLRHPALGLLAARAQHAPRLLRPCVWTSWCSATGGEGCSRAGGPWP